MPTNFIVLLIFLGVFWLLVTAGAVAGCVLSSQISQREERMWKNVHQKKGVKHHV